MSVVLLEPDGVMAALGLLSDALGGVMPPERGRRLATLLPNARQLEIPDSYTRIPSASPLTRPRPSASSPAPPLSSGGDHRQLSTVASARRDPGPKLGSPVP